MSEDRTCWAPDAFEPLIEGEVGRTETTHARRGHARASATALLRDPVGVVSLLVVILLVALALAAPLVAPADPYAQNLTDRLLAPCAAHPLGTDELGRDLCSRLVFGCRVSLSVAIASQAIALLVGFALGACAGYGGGRTDAVISFLIQVFSSFPFLLFALIVMYSLGPGLVNVYVALGLLMWTTTARLVRAESLRIRESDYVLACLVAGGSRLRVIVRHLLPNCLPTLVVAATLGIPNAILCEASLSFLGLGVQPPMASWGSPLPRPKPTS